MRSDTSAAKRSVLFYYLTCLTMFSLLFNGNSVSLKGHILGYASVRGNAGTPERNCSVAAVSIIRAIMHSSFLWFSCQHSDCIGDLARVVSVSPHDLPEFFWTHLQKDVENLSSSVERSAEEAAILVHLVLKRILVENPPNGIVNNNIGQ